MDKAKLRVVERSRRAKRVRRGVEGTTERPRLCVHRTLNHIYAQIVDDEKGTTLVTVDSRSKELTDKTAGKEKLTKKDVSKLVGEIAAEKAKEKGVSKVVFDRKGYLYHGRVKALADGARAKGLVF